MATAATIVPATPAGVPATLAPTQATINTLTPFLQAQLLRWAKSDAERLITPLHRAMLHGSPRDVRTLLKVDADVNARTNNGMTPLHYAFLAGTPWERLKSCIKLLGKRKADFNRAADDGQTPMHWAANLRWKDGGDVAATLCKYGANPNAQNAEGASAFAIAGAGAFSDSLLAAHKAKKKECEYLVASLGEIECTGLAHTLREVEAGRADLSTKLDKYSEDPNAYAFNEEGVYAHVVEGASAFLDTLLEVSGISQEHSGVTQEHSGDTQEHPA
jgi:hypothetical protein